MFTSFFKSDSGDQNWIEPSKLDEIARRIRWAYERVAHWWQLRTNKHARIREEEDNRRIEDIMRHVLRSQTIRAGMPRGVLYWASPMEVEIRRLRAAEAREATEDNICDKHAELGPICWVCVSESVEQGEPREEPEETGEWCDMHGLYECWHCEGLRRGLKLSADWDGWWCESHTDLDCQRCGGHDKN